LELLEGLEPSASSFVD